MVSDRRLITDTRYGMVNGPSRFSALLVLVDHASTPRFSSLLHLDMFYKPNQYKKRELEAKVQMQMHSILQRAPTVPLPY